MTDTAKAVSRDVIDVAPQVVAARPETPPALSESAAIFQIIERAARDPNVDIDKMERLVAMQERVKDRNARAAYAEALAAMQEKLPVIAERGGIKDKSGKVQSKYALWEDINQAIKPVMAAHGFALSFRTGREDGHIVVTGVLSHRDGHSEETAMHLPIDGSGSKNAVQAVGSSTSYGKRYTAAALLNLTSGGEDDDGHAAGAAPTLSEEQVERLQALIIEVGADIGRFLEYAQADSLSDIKASDFAAAVAKLEAKRQRRAVPQ